MFMISEVKQFQTNSVIHVKGSFGGGRSFSAPRVSVPRFSAPRVITSTPRVSAPAPRVSAPRVSAPRVSTPAPRVSQPRSVTNNYYHGNYGYHPGYGYGYGYHPYYYYAYHPGYWFSYNFWNYMWFSSIMNQQQQVVIQQQTAPQNSVGAPQYQSQTQIDPNQQPTYPQPQEDTNYAGYAIAIAVVILGVFWWTRRK